MDMLSVCVCVRVCLRTCIVRSTLWIYKSKVKDSWYYCVTTGLCVSILVAEDSAINNNKKNSKKINDKKMENFTKKSTCSLVKAFMINARAEKLT